MKNNRKKIFSLLVIFMTSLTAFSVKEMCDWKETWKYTELIAGGAYGAAYTATHVTEGGTFAIKEQYLGKQFDKEVKAYSDLKNKNFANIPTVYEVWRCERKGYIRMQKLSKCLSPRATLSEVKTFIVRVKAVIKKLNKAGWAHLDMHSGNVMCDPATLKMKLIDFGIASKLKGTAEDAFSLRWQNNKIGQMARNLELKSLIANPPPGSRSRSSSPSISKEEEKKGEERRSRSRSRDRTDSNDLNDHGY